MMNKNLIKTVARRVAAAAACILITMNAAAQLKQFSLEDLNFGGTNYHNMIPEYRNITWWGDELVLRNAEECKLVNKANGKETTLFTEAQLNAWAKTNEDSKILNLGWAQFPYAGKSLVLIANKQERMLIDFKKKAVVWRQASKGQEFADWNNASKAVAYVSDHNLYVMDAEGKTTQLSTDGSREIVYGQAVHRNEFASMKGTFWSPDGTKLAFNRMDQSMVADYPQVNTFEREATYEPDKYPMCGMTSHKVTIGVYDMKTGKTVYLKAGDPTDRYFTNLAWAPDGKKVYMFELNRDQNDCRLTAYDAETGEKTGELYREVDEKYVEPLNPIVFLPWDKSQFIMQSRQDGYKHLYLCTLGMHGSRMASNTKSLEVEQLTEGKWEVLSVLGFNSKTKSIIYKSNEASPIQQNVYSVSVANKKRTRIDEGGKGWHEGSTISASGRYLLDNYQEPTVPRRIVAIDTQTGKSHCILNAKDPWKEKGYNIPEYSCGKLKAADGTTDLYWRMVKPVDFDPNKKYPTVVYVYGGPHAHNVDARWHYSSRSWETYMAQKGYLLFILDNRGSEHRGKDFEQATFRQLGQEEMKDQMKGVEYLKSLPYVDQDRMGVHGWSFGGFMTISLMTNYPDVFKVGVAGGPVIDWKWYEVMYGERYMDTPESNPEGYAKTSLLNKAKDLKGKLQIITGMNDPTVVPQNCLMFLNACSEAGTQPDFFAYPGEGHNMMGHKSVHLHERITQYFEDYLK
ncbi:MAG: S9 family peptidase [Prevotella pectinovora]|uniref:S9 family peptidase n=1 Tax=Prevotella pectinovora TaxID=1602169 RepID=UPI00242CD220|nr:DPP IV N-terminal domain-containing protein [Prevotella pectinovora]MCI6047661.1 S9 family peptidase [Prevotella pectinovora]